LFDRIGDHYRKKVLERKTEIEKQMKEREERKKEVERELKEKGTIVFGGGRGDGPTSAKE
jgi:predicted phage-related endonuclease